MYREYCRTQAECVDSRYLGVGGQGEEALHEFLMSCAAPLCEKLAGMVGIFEVAMALIGARMSGDEFVVVIDTQALGIGLQSQAPGSVFSRNGVAVGLYGDAKLLGGSNLRDGGEIKGMGRQGAQIRFFFWPQLTGWLSGFAVYPDIGHGREPVLGGGVQSTEGGDVETGEEVFLT